MKPSQDGWQPSCSTQMLRIRAEMLREIREFFCLRGFLEVETPCLSRDIVLDTGLEPFVLDVHGERWFLQTSPEAHMKRLLAAGVGSIFQISRVFRQHERGQRHNIEFTMIEWYAVGSTWLEQLKTTELLVRAAASAAARVTGCNVADLWSPAEFQRTTYADAFQRVFHIDVFSCSGNRLIQAAKDFGIALPHALDENCVDDILNAMLALAIEPQLGGPTAGAEVHPEFICDYPPSQAALAVVADTFPHKVARRFELYVQGLELCNGYQELADADEVLSRDALQNQRRTEDQSPPLPGAPRMMAAMRFGLPACSGVALGFDRLVMLATGCHDIREVMPFPEERA